MAGALITYDKELPEIQNRLPWIEPNSHLVKDDTKASGWREEEGRRPSSILLAPKIRKNVDEWRANGYPGASEVSKHLFRHWFEEDHEVAGFDKFYFGQREAIETSCVASGSDRQHRYNETNRRLCYRSEKRHV